MFGEPPKTVKGKITDVMLPSGLSSPRAYIQSPYKRTNRDVVKLNDWRHEGTEYAWQPIDLPIDRKLIFTRSMYLEHNVCAVNSLILK